MKKKTMTEAFERWRKRRQLNRQIMETWNDIIACIVSRDELQRYGFPEEDIEAVMKRQIEKEADLFILQFERESL